MSPAFLAVDTASVRRIIEPWFDVSYYLFRYVDVEEAGDDAVEHYIVHGWREFRDPHPNFSTRHYLSTNSDVRDAGVNPFLHYIVIGRWEGRAPVPPLRDGDHAPQAIQQADSSPLPEQSAEFIRSAIESVFDKEFYLLSYSDVRLAKVDPLDHYIRRGWKESRDPHPEFSTSYYLEVNSDVREAGINPYFHYVVAGRGEGRPPRRPGGFRSIALRGLVSLDKRINEWRREDKVPAKRELLSSEQLLHILADRLTPGHNRYVISFSHDDYLNVPGGIQLCLVLEQQAFKNNSTLYLHIHPWQTLPILREDNDAHKMILSLICDGEFVGLATPSTVATVCKKMASRGATSAIVVHSLLGHSPEFIVRLYSVSRSGRCFFWVHDYFSLCPGYTLLRNDITFCGGPPVESAACSICIYGEERPGHNARMRAMFDRVPFVIVAPSQPALDLWRDRTGFAHVAGIVHEHCRVEFSEKRTSAGKSTRKSGIRAMPVRVAYLGFRTLHKGWPVFESLCAKLRRDPKYELFHLGQKPDLDQESDAWLKFIPVRVTVEHPAAMAEAISAERIDAVVLWSVWPETFGFVAHETMAGGALVITNNQSGNIARIVQQMDSGFVFENETELHAAFQSGEIIRVCLAKRRERLHKRGRIEFSRITADLCFQE